MVQLNDDLVDALDQEASRRSMSRSALIRELLEEALAATTEAAVTAAIVEGYRRVPPGRPDEWGDLEAEADRQTRETNQRLAAEEADAGLAW
jgi:predicted transcriptional regulator